MCEVMFHNNQLRMKKLVIMLAVIGVLASCSKETPVVPVDQQSQAEQESLLRTPDNINDSDSDSKGIRYSFDAEIEPFELATEGFDGSKTQTEEARAINTYFGPGNRKGSKAEFISYKLSNESDLQVRAVVYDNQGVASFTAKAEVTPDGKGVHFNFPEQNVGKILGLRAIFNRIKFGTSQNPRLALLVNSGKDGAWSDRFDNKGAYLYEYSAGKSIELPKNFVVLKSVENPLEYKNGKIQVKTGHQVKLKMQGYLLAIRFRNHAYPTVIKYTWKDLNGNPYQSNERGDAVSSPVFVKRPDLRLTVRVQDLSFSHAVQFQFNRTDPNRFITEAVIKNGTINKDYNTPGLIPSKTNSDEFTVRFQNTNSHVVRVPVELGSASRRKKPNGNPNVDRVAFEKTALREGEQIALLYCPDPVSSAIISFLADDTLFYDLSDFCQSMDEGQRVYYGVNNVPNTIVKTIGTIWDESIGANVSKANGKVFLPMFHIEPYPQNRHHTPTGITMGSERNERLRKARWEAYKKRNEEAVRY